MLFKIYVPAPELYSSAEPNFVPGLTNFVDIFVDLEENICISNKRLA